MPYDLLNEIGLDAQSAAVRVNEVELAHRQLETMQSGDVLVWDRSRTGYLLMAAVEDLAEEVLVAADSANLLLKCGSRISVRIASRLLVTEP